MKEFHATAGTTVSASVEDCLVLLRDIESYPRWFPGGVRSVEVVQRGDDGRATRTRALLHVAQGPLARDFRVLLAVTFTPPGTLRLSRVPDGSGDREELEVTWEVRGGAGTEIRISLQANLSVPRLLPVGGVGESLARGFVSSAARELDRTPS
ncbi:MAG: SRPBCC family protein [Solirubrobacteraceae bacterium]